MRQLVRILTKLMPRSLRFILASDDNGGGNKITEQQVGAAMGGWAAQGGLIGHLCGRGPGLCRAEARCCRQMVAVGRCGRGRQWPCGCRLEPAARVLAWLWGPCSLASCAAPPPQGPAQHEAPPARGCCAILQPSTPARPLPTTAYPIPPHLAHPHPVLQIHNYLGRLLGDNSARAARSPPHPVWGLPEGWGEYIAQLFRWGHAALGAGARACCRLGAGGGAVGLEWGWG
jgi:hypothetical protein